MTGPTDHDSFGAPDADAAPGTPDRHDTVAMSPEALARLRGRPGDSQDAAAATAGDATVFGQPAVAAADAAAPAWSRPAAEAAPAPSFGAPAEGPGAPAFGVPSAASPHAGETQPADAARPEGRAGSSAYGSPAWREAADRRAALGAGVGAGVRAGLGAAPAASATTGGLDHAAAAAPSSEFGIPARFGGEGAALDSAEPRPLGEADAIEEPLVPGLEASAADADGATRERAAKPWYRRPWVFLAAGAALLALLAAILVPVFSNLANAQKGDQLADAYTGALAEHEAVWTEERLAALEGLDVAGSLEENADFFSQTQNAMTQFTAQCDRVSAASTALSELTASPMPMLESAEGAEASGRFAEAQTLSTANTARAEAEQALVDEGAAHVAALSEFCVTLPQYNSVYNDYTNHLETVLKPALTLKNGDTVTLTGNLRWTCRSDQGCADLYTESTRRAYADAFDQTNTTFYSTFADLASKQCFLEEMQTVCDAYAANWSGAAASYQAATDALRNEQPTVAAGSALYPNFESNNKAGSDAVKAGDSAVATAWQAVDPEAAADIANAGWQSRSIKRVLGEHQTALDELVAAVRAA